MRKQITSTVAPRHPSGEDWLDLERLARVELSSEDPAHPIEGALDPGHHEGWRAAEPGEQVLRVVFDEPQRVRRVLLEFVEPTAERTQEYTLRWEPADGSGPREIARQQWNFSPGGSTQEREDHEVDLREVRALVLAIRPDVAGGEARATLAALRIA